MRKKTTDKSQGILELIDAALAADYSRVRRAGTTLAALLEGTEPDVAKEIRSLIRRRGVPLRASGYMEALPVDSKSRLPLLEEVPAPGSPIFLDASSSAVFQNFIADVRHSAKLSAKGLATRLSLLLSGPPGTGKSLLAGHIALQLDRPLYSVRLDSVISSLLGDTAKNIRNVFEYVPSKDGVLFLDEMDAIAKLRDDRHELGELKRVVNTVIQGLDSLDDNAIVIGATNHSQLLDAAIWRRFPYKIELSLPDESVREEMWRHFLFEDQGTIQIPEILARISNGLSGADIQGIAFAGRRHAILTNTPVDVASIAWATLETVTGRRTTPPREGLPTEKKRAAAVALVKDKGIAQADVGRLLGVTRQAISAYLKGSQDGRT